ncbi:MAG TPA: sigma-70 family RNA polymerase sigma factor [Pseudolabrys sp.]|nr:sigma-70 family RNA polymerase sigma factor [Pseudolabrys sp.]
MSIAPLRPRAGPINKSGPPVRLVTPGPQDLPGALDDAARFRTVVLPHIDEAYRLARWLTGNGTDAEDVVQDASLRAFRAIRSYAGGNPRAWLLSIVRNTAYSWLRKNRSTTVVAVDDLDAVEREQTRPIDCNESPETSLIAKVDGEQLRAAIADLPPPFRETLVLRDIEGLDYREIAEATEVPIGTVMSRLARARRRLIQRLRQDD